SFKQALRVIGAYAYHFWMAAMTPLRRVSGNQYLPHKSVNYRDAVRRKIAAYHRHIQLGLIAQGLLQILSATKPTLIWQSFGSWIRTVRPGLAPSEQVVAIALRNTLPEFLASAANPSILVKFIRDRLDLSRTEGTSLAASESALTNRYSQEPKAGVHFTWPTPNRSAAEFAQVIGNLVEHYPAASTIHLVMDNLNIHCRKSLTDYYGGERGRAVWDRFTVHYTPKHGSWLNQAEIEISLFSRGCLGSRRIPNLNNFETPSQGLEPTDQSRSRQNQLEVRPQGRSQEVRLQILFQSVEDLVLLATYDLWSTRKIHRATIWGSVFLILMGQIGGFIGPTAPWHAFAHWVQSLGV